MARVASEENGRGAGVWVLPARPDAKERVVANRSGTTRLLDADAVDWLDGFLHPTAKSKVVFRENGRKVTEYCVDSADGVWVAQRQLNGDLPVCALS